MASRLEIKTAAELADPEMEARWTARRSARQTDLFRRILRAFVARGGRISVKDIVDTSPASAVESIHDALLGLDRDDVIRIQDGHVDIAYPFSAIATPFVVRLPGGAERYACCAIDALGIAPMIGTSVQIRSRCHHGPTPIEFSTAPGGPGPESAGVMLWHGGRAGDRCRVADSL